MTKITVDLTGSAQTWYECACDRCRLQFENDIREAIELATKLLFLCDLNPRRAVIAAYRNRLISRNKRLRLPIAEFSLGTVSDLTSGHEMLALTEIHSVPDCPCTTIH